MPETLPQVVALNLNKDQATAILGYMTIAKIAMTNPVAFNDFCKASLSEENNRIIVLSACMLLGPVANEEEYAVIRQLKTLMQAAGWCAR